MDKMIGIIKKNDNLRGEVYRTIDSLYYAKVISNGVEVTSQKFEDEDTCYSIIQDKFNELLGAK